MLVLIDTDECEELMPYFHSLIEESPPEKANPDDDWALWDVQPSGAVDDWSCLFCNPWALQDKCSLYGLDKPINTGGVFHTAFGGAEPVGEHGEALEQLGGATVSVQQLNVKLLRYEKPFQTLTHKTDLLHVIKQKTLMIGSRANAT